MPSKGHIAIYTQDAKLGHEVKGATRYVYLATLLCEQGYDVILLPVAFNIGISSSEILCTSI